MALDTEEKDNRYNPAKIENDPSLTGYLKRTKPKLHKNTAT